MHIGRDHVLGYLGREEATEDNDKVTKLLAILGRKWVTKDIPGSYEARSGLGLGLGLACLGLRFFGDM